MCGAPQTWKRAQLGGPFACVSCGESLRIPDFYTKRILIASFAVSLAGAFAWLQTGFITPIVVAIVLSLPMSFFVGSIMRHVWPPVLQVDPGNSDSRLRG
jgi:hypothetical protein